MRQEDPKKVLRGKPLRLDPKSVSTDADKPAFLARPVDSPVYYGFPIVEESETDGWFYGAITDYECETPQNDGDGFVVAPDGSRAGIVWDLDGPDFEEVSPPTSDRWGVYGVRFPDPVESVDDLVRNFRAVLPNLKKRYAQIREDRT
jgi:hypothetical protein